MTTLSPQKAKNDRQINAIQFNTTEFSRLVSLAAATTLTIPVPDSTQFIRFAFPPGEIIYVSDTTPITIPGAGNILNGNSEINPGIRILPTGTKGRSIYAFSTVALTFGVYFYDA